MHVNPGQHQPILWHNPALPDITAFIANLRLAERLATYDKLSRRYAKMDQRSAAWLLLQPYVIFVLITLVGPGAILVAQGNLVMGSTLFFAGLIVAVAIEASFTLRYRWLKKKLQGALHEIRKKFPVGTLLSDELAWHTLDAALRPQGASLMIIMNSTLLFEATARDIQAYLDETYTDFQDLKRSAELPENVRNQALEAVRRVARQYAASINLTVARVHLRQIEKGKDA